MTKLDAGDDRIFRGAAFCGPGIGELPQIFNILRAK